MSVKKMAGIQKNGFETSIPGLTDDQLGDVLKKRDLYREEAAKMAIQEAMKRGLIHSEEDLMAPHFRPEPMQSGFIPVIEDPKNREKIRRSIGRSLLIAGLLPLIWGILKMNTGPIPEGLFVLAFGVAWISVSAWMIRRSSLSSVKILFLLSIGSLFYVIRLLGAYPATVFMDWFIVVVIYLLIAYGLIFIFRLGK